MCCKAGITWPLLSKDSAQHSTVLTLSPLGPMSTEQLQVLPSLSLAFDRPLRPHHTTMSRLLAIKDIFPANSYRWIVFCLDGVASVMTSRVVFEPWAVMAVTYLSVFLVLDSEAAANEQLVDRAVLVCMFLKLVQRFHPC